MSFRRSLLLALAISAGTVLNAQPFSGSPSSDQRLRRIEYGTGQVYAIDVTSGYQLTIALAPDEHIQTVALGNQAAFQVSASQSGDALFLKALQPGTTTNMTVVTDTRHYAFTLTAVAGTPSTYTVQFQYPRSSTASTVPGQAIGYYKLSGSKSLWPSAITDDGVHVSIAWPANVDLPAIYALDGQGRESLTNGMMRGDHIVIDGIAPRLVFRLDRVMAVADRYLPKAKAR